MIAVYEVLWTNLSACDVVVLLMSTRRKNRDEDRTVEPREPVAQQEAREGRRFCDGGRKQIPGLAAYLRRSVIPAGWLAGAGWMAAGWLAQARHRRRAARRRSVSERQDKRPASYRTRSRVCLIAAWMHTTPWPLPPPRTPRRHPLMRCSSFFLCPSPCQVFCH